MKSFCCYFIRTALLKEHVVVVVVVVSPPKENVLPLEKQIANNVFFIRFMALKKPFLSHQFITIYWLGTSPKPQVNPSNAPAHAHHQSKN